MIKQQNDLVRRMGEDLNRQTQGMSLQSWLTRITAHPTLSSVTIPQLQLIGLGDFLPKAIKLNQNSLLKPNDFPLFMWVIIYNQLAFNQTTIFISGPEAKHCGFSLPPHPSKPSSNVPLFGKPSQTPRRHCLVLPLWPYQTFVGLASITIWVIIIKTVLNWLSAGLPLLKVAGLGAEGLSALTLQLLDCERVQNIPGKKRDGFVDWGWGEVETGFIYQLLCKYLNILTTKEVLVLTESISALITTLISLYYSILLTTRL